MTEPVRISLIGDQLTAALPTGDVLSADDADSLADLLFARGVAVDQVRCADWHEGDAAPLVGQAVAIKSRLRALATGLDRPQDALSLALHLEAVKLMQADDGLRLRALAILDRWDTFVDPSSKPLRDEWRRILQERDWDAALSLSERGNQIRQASPCCVMHEDRRLEIIQQHHAQRRGGVGRPLAEYQEAVAKLDKDIL